MAEAPKKGDVVFLVDLRNQVTRSFISRVYTRKMKIDGKDFDVRLHPGGYYERPFTHFSRPHGRAYINQADAEREYEKQYWLKERHHLVAQLANCLDIEKIKKVHQIFQGE